MMRSYARPIGRILRSVPLVAVAALVAACAGAEGRLAQSGPAPDNGAAPSTGAAEASAPVTADDPALFEGLEYRMVGPSRGGRVTAVAGHRAHPSTFYMGATGGGVWKTTDNGHTWRNISDGYFATPSIGAIRVAPSDPSVVYVGTGTDGIRSNVIAGRGVYKSTDAGETWEHVGLENAGQIGRMAVHPENPEIAYAAAIGNPFGTNEQRGVFRTTDGGDTWEKVLFISDSVGVYGLVMEPGDPDVLYAGAWRGQRTPWTIISGTHTDAGAGIYKSTDGGDTWRRLDGGLPEGLVGKIDLDISPANPDRVYALVEAPDSLEGLYRSDDAGRTWQFVNGDQKLLHRPFYFTNIHVDPTDSDVVYANALRFHKSTDAGETWKRIDTPHGDNQDLWINPDDPEIMVQGNDGGANVTLDGGESWSTIHNQPTAELYQVDVSDEFPYRLCAGQQDNSTICVPSRPTGRSGGYREARWRTVAGCETGPAVPKPGDPAIVFGNCKGRFGVYNHRTGQEQNYWVGANYMYGHAARDLEFRFQRVSPIEVSPHDPNVVYHASQYLHRTDDGGETWETVSPDLTARPEGTQGVSGEPITRDITGEEFYSTLYAVEESPLEKGLIWVGSNDGLFHVTRNGGADWTEVTPPDLPSGGRIQSIDPSPHRSGKAYFTVLRYLLDDWKPYVYKTEDYGESWELLTDGTNGIPADHPVRVVREDPNREGLLYAGTEFGMFVSFDDGESWQSFQRNLPVTPVTDLKVHRNDLVLSTMGRSFWILDDLTPLHRLTDEIARSEAHLFSPRDAHRMRYWTRGSGPADPEYPEAGAMVYYWLGDDVDGEVTLEIVDDDGTVIRGITSDSAGYAYHPADDAAMRGMDDGTVRVQGPTLPTDRGLHRFTWDLRLPGAWHEDADRNGRRGPMAVPGDYRVRLSIGDWSQMRPLRVRMDPRLAAEGLTRADLEEQLALNLDIRDAIGEARKAAARIDAAQEALSDEGALRRLADLEERIVTDPNDEIGSYPQPMLIDQLEYLYGMTSRADQKPGRDAHVRYAELREELDGYLGALDRVLDGTVAEDE